jgi:WD40 repeat protein
VVGSADVLAPSPGEPTLWLGRWRRHDRASVLWLREMDSSGKVLVRARALLPRMGLLHAALKRGFVLTSGRWLTVWDHFSDVPRRIARDGWFVAASEARVAWCGGDCGRIQVWSRRGRRTLAPPGGTRPLGSVGAFSPDGRLLATGVTAGKARLALVDLRSGKWTLVPGGALAGYDAIAWSPSGRWLYFTDSDEGLRAWRLGAPSAVSLPIDPGGTVMSIATPALSVAHRPSAGAFAGFPPL